MTGSAEKGGGLRRGQRPFVNSTVIAAGAFVVALLILVANRHNREPEVHLPPAMLTVSSTSAPVSQTRQDLLYGRITTEDGNTYEGRLRFGGTEEAFWGDYFNGFKDENPWIAHVQPERLKERYSIELFGLEIAHWESQRNFERPFMARFGDIERIEALRRDIRVTLRSGTVFELDRYSADDLADGVRVWDIRGDFVDFDEWKIRLIEFLPTGDLGNAPDRLHGTVQTRHGKFTGFVQWNREEGVATDELNGHTADGELGIPFDTIRSIEHDSGDGSLVTLLDNREIVLFGSREVGQDNRGLYVDDRRYGRVLVSWDAFERVDFNHGGIGPAYRDFPKGHALTGSVTTRAGNRITGRLVYDLDESETTETLDAPSRGVDYTIPFGLIATIVPPGGENHDDPSAQVLLHRGEKLELEDTGDLGEGNAGMLIFVDGRVSPEYLKWTEIERIDFDRPPSTYPPIASR